MAHFNELGELFQASIENRVQEVYDALLLLKRGVTLFPHEVGVGLSLQQIAAVVKEITTPLEGGWIQKVFQPTPRAITLEIRTPGHTLALFLSADPETSRLHLLSHRYPNPPTPPPFCSFLRAHIQGARLEAMEQIQNDRVVRLRMVSRAGPCSLIAELIGRRADLVLVDADDKIVISLNSGRDRAGQPYLIAPRPDRSGSLDDQNRSTGSHEDHPFPLSRSIERSYQEREAELARARLRQERLSEIRKRMKKTARRVEALQSDLEKCARYRDYVRYGELLKANLHQMKKGQERLTVIDYFDPAMPELVIPLDPAKTPHGNMDDYFKKHRKYLGAEREIRPRLKAEEHRLTVLREECAAIERGENHVLSPPSPRPVIAGERTRLKESTGRSGPFRRFTSWDGLPMYVGRNARENDTLTFNEARPDDLWLHAQGAPGSHVLVRVEKGADPPPETLRDAATLALLYSDLKKSGKGEVIYTRRKYVRKVKGKNLGSVTVTQEKTIFVVLDRARLDRLKERSG